MVFFSPSAPQGARFAGATYDVASGFRVSVGFVVAILRTPVRPENI